MLFTGAGAAPDRLDATVDHTGADTLPAGTAWRWSGLLTAPANPGGTGWQLKVAGSWQLGTGTRALWIGSSSRDPLLQGTVAIK